MSDNLWGTFNLEDLINPLDILKEQSGYLMNMTNNVIFADMRTRPTNEDWDEPRKEFATTFLLMSKLLDNYQFELFTLYYDITFFPMSVQLDENLADFFEMDEWVTLRHEEDYMDFLKSTLNNDYTNRIIKSMYALSK